jgi:hypothetical protein
MSQLTKPAPVLMPPQLRSLAKPQRPPKRIAPIRAGATRAAGQRAAMQAGWTAQTPDAPRSGRLAAGPDAMRAGRPLALPDAGAAEWSIAVPRVAGQPVAATASLQAVPPPWTAWRPVAALVAATAHLEMDSPPEPTPVAVRAASLCRSISAPAD